MKDTPTTEPNTDYGTPTNTKTPISTKHTHIRHEKPTTSTNKPNSKTPTINVSHTTNQPNKRLKTTTHVSPIPLSTQDYPKPHTPLMQIHTYTQATHTMTTPKTPKLRIPPRSQHPHPHNQLLHKTTIIPHGPITPNQTRNMQSHFSNSWHTSTPHTTQNFLLGNRNKKHK